MANRKLRKVGNLANLRKVRKSPSFLFSYFRDFRGIRVFRPVRYAKRNYDQRILQVEQGTFSPFVFSIYGGMGRECLAFYSRLSELLAEKRNIHKSVIMHWIRSKLCYALLKSCLLCLRGSRSWNRNITELEQHVAAQYELCSIR